MATRETSSPTFPTGLHNPRTSLGFQTRLMAMNCKAMSLVGLVTLAGLLWLQPAGWAASGDKSPPAAKASANAQSANLSPRQEALAREKQRVATERSEVETLIREHETRLKALTKEGVTRSLLEQTAFEVDAQKLKVQSIEVEQQEIQRGIEELEAQVAGLIEQIKMLRNSATGPADTGKPTHITRLEAELESRNLELQLEKDRLSVSQSAYLVAKEHQGVLSRWYQNLQHVYLSQQELSHTEALDQLQSRIQNEQQDLQKQADEARTRLAQIKGDDNKSKADRSLLETQIQNLEERVRLRQVDLTLAQAKYRLDNLIAATQGAEVTPASLKSAVEQTDALARDLDGTHRLLRDKVAVLEEKRQLLEKRLALMPEVRKEINQESQVVVGLTQDLQLKLGNLQNSVQKINTERDLLKSRYDQSIQHSLKIRRILPPDMVAWKEAVLESLSIPRQFSQQCLATAKQIAMSIERNGTSRLSLMILLEVLWLLAMVWLRQALISLSKRFEQRQDRFWVRLILLVYDLLIRAIPLAAVLGMAVLFLLLMDSPEPATSTMVALAVTALVFKALIDLSWLLLAAPTTPEESQLPVLYRKLRWILGLTGVFTALHMFLHFLPTSLTIKDLVNRLFMFLLLLLTILVWRSRRLILGLLRALFAERTLWIKAAEWISLGLPVTILVALLLGLVGYVNLAWTIAGYVGWFLVVLVAWLLLHGLLQDLIIGLRTRLSATDSKETVWTQGLVDPVYRVVKWVLFAGALLVLFQLFGWDSESPVMRVIGRILTTPLLPLGSRALNLLDLLLTGAIIIGVVLAARWSRELTHRWIFSGIADSGTRHSLSVFTQYAVVFIGVLTTLRVLGIDLTTFAVFAGALGVGIGLGLQSIANNFISGILLLVERPLRTGDYVTIGSNEGLVTRIGIRSLTVRSVDNQEIIIPNADVISNQFTNWTHSDSLVRMKLELGISYDNDPADARRLIEEALAADPLVLKTPTPRVWLKEYGDSSVNFLIFYFIDMNTCTGWESKSSVLFAIWDRFEGAGIKIPYPHREIIMRSEKPGASNKD